MESDDHEHVWRACMDRSDHKHVWRAMNLNM